MDQSSLDAAEAPPVDQGLVALGDGRTIGWTAWGAHDGPTVVSQPHLGDPGTRALASDVAPLTESGIRLLAICRAGLGPSTRNPARTEQTDAADMLKVVDALRLNRVHLLAECGGTGTVLALAARWPDRVKGIALVSAMAPLVGPEADSYVRGESRAFRRALRWGPIARWVAHTNVRAFGRDPSGFQERAWKSLPAVDRALVEDPMRRALGLAVVSDFYASTERVLDEWRSMVRPWTFDLAAVQTRVNIDHGALDTTCPVGMARWLSDRVPSADLRIDPDRGHFMSPIEMADILKQLVSVG